MTKQMELVCHSAGICFFVWDCTLSRDRLCPAINSIGVAADDPIPSFLSLQPRSKGRKTARAALPQLSLDLSAPEPPRPVPPPAKPVLPVPILYTVARLLTELRQHVEGAYTGLLHVEGEISNCRPAASGHIYFTLKDQAGDAQLPVVLFRRQAGLLGFKPKDGMAVEARGRISVYETRGQIQLIAESLRPRGEGAMQLAFEQLKRRLKAEGLFDRPRRPLPPFPHCIGVVTSPTGAAIRDIIQVVRRRHARLNLLIFPAVVQGPSCAASVARGIRWFNGHPERVDLILIARGGGSIEDLAGFNDERLARIIAASELPVVSAIGHEIDHTIADFVADLRAPTPSAAAELITAAQHRIEERVLSLERRVHRAGEFQLLRARQRLQRLSAEHVLARLRDTIGRREQRIDELRFRLTAAIARRLRNRANRLAALEARLRRHDPTVRLALANRRLDNANERLKRLAQEIAAQRRTRLAHTSARLEALSPLAVLNRGYAIVYLESDTMQPAILRDAANAQPEQQIRARLARGSVRALITATEIQTP
jgi:exodeoxyribonuclease VII large subunit